jgi:hypothetical protein
MELSFLSYLRCPTAFPFKRIKFFYGIFNSMLRPHILDENDCTIIRK